MFQGSIKYVKAFTCSCNLATQSETEADESKRIYDLATHKFSVLCISLLKWTGNPHQKDFCLGRKWHLSHLCFSHSSFQEDIKHPLLPNGSFFCFYLYEQETYSCGPLEHCLLDSALWHLVVLVDCPTMIVPLMKCVRCYPWLCWAAILAGCCTTLVNTRGYIRNRSVKCCSCCQQKAPALLAATHPPSHCHFLLRKRLLNSVDFCPAGHTVPLPELWVRHLWLDYAARQTSWKEEYSPFSLLPLLMAGSVLFNSQNNNNIYCLTRGLYELKKKIKLTCLFQSHALLILAGTSWTNGLKLTSNSHLEKNNIFSHVITTTAHTNHNYSACQFSVYIMITLPKSISWFKNSKCNAKETFAELTSVATLVWGKCFLQNGKQSKKEISLGTTDFSEIPQNSASGWLNPII